MGMEPPLKKKKKKILCRKQKDNLQDREVGNGFLNGHEKYK